MWIILAHRTKVTFGLPEAQADPSQKKEPLFANARNDIRTLNNYLSNMFFGIAEGIDYLDIRQIPFLVRDNAYNLERVIYV